MTYLHTECLNRHAEEEEEEEKIQRRSCACSQRPPYLVHVADRHRGPRRESPLLGIAAALELFVGESNGDFVEYGVLDFPLNERAGDIPPLGWDLVAVLDDADRGVELGLVVQSHFTRNVGAQVDKK